LTNRDAGAVSPETILSRIRQNLLDLFLIDTVITDVRLTRCPIEVEAKIHRHQYTEIATLPGKLNWQAMPPQLLILIVIPRLVSTLIETVPIRPNSADWLPGSVLAGAR
jgi:hypothetical protein